MEPEAKTVEKKRGDRETAHLDLAGYIRDELGFPGVRQGVMLEKERVDIATGEVSRERWYLLTSLSSRRCAPKELLRVIRNHWSVENSLHHVKDRSWDEDVHTLRRGEVPGSTQRSTPCAWRDGFPSRCPCPCEPRPAPSAQPRPSPAFAAKSPDFAIVLR